MKNTFLYRVPYDAFLPALKEPEQRIEWTENEFEEGTILLYLRDFDLVRTRNTASNMADMVDMSTLLIEPVTWKIYDDIRYKANKELEETWKIKGSLFLTPCFQKVWLSHYDIKYLIKVSSSP